LSRSRVERVAPWVSVVGIILSLAAGLVMSWIEMRTRDRESLRDRAELHRVDAESIRDRAEMRENIRKTLIERADLRRRLERLEKRIGGE
jgi:hypothetical protein